MDIFTKVVVVSVLLFFHVSATPTASSGPGKCMYCLHATFLIKLISPPRPRSMCFEIMYSGWLIERLIAPSGARAWFQAIDAALAELNGNR